MRDTVPSLTLTASLESLQPALAFVRKGACEAGLPETRTGEIDLIIEEILMNISRYAYPEGEGELTVQYWISGPGEMRLEVSDQGREFNPLAASSPDLTLDLEDRPIGGLGLVLIRAFADSLTYRREDGWNRLSFTISAGAISAGH